MPRRIAEAAEQALARLSLVMRTTGARVRGQVHWMDSRGLDKSARIVGQLLDEIDAELATLAAEVRRLAAIIDADVEDTMPGVPRPKD